MEAVVEKWNKCQSYVQYVEVVDSSFKPLVAHVLQADAATAVNFRKRHVDKFADVLFLFLETLQEAIASAQDPDQELPRKRLKGSSFGPPDFTSPVVQGRVLDLMHALQLPASIESGRFACRRLQAFQQEYERCARSEGKKRSKAEGNDVSKFFTLKAYKRAFTRAWGSILSLPLTNDLKLAVMRSMPDEILPNVSQAWIFSDFLSNAFNLGGIYALYALRGLFILMTKHNLDYPDLYQKLYSLFTSDMLHSKYRARFLDLLGLLLTSTRLPAYLVASFIKKASRLTLMAPTPTINFLIVIIYNLLKSHPEATVLIHRTKAMDFKATAVDSPEATAMLQRLYEGLDPFLEDETDPQKTNALYSSCWELKMLQNHYYPGVSAEADVFQQEMKVGKKDWNIHSSKSYLKLFLKEVGRFDPKKAPVATTFHDAEGLFDTAGHTSLAWQQIWQP